MYLLYFFHLLARFFFNLKSLEQSAEMKLTLGLVYTETTINEIQYTCVDVGNQVPCIDNQRWTIQQQVMLGSQGTSDCVEHILNGPDDQIVWCTKF